MQQCAVAFFSLLSPPARGPFPQKEKKAAEIKKQMLLLGISGEVVSGFGSLGLMDVEGDTRTTGICSEDEEGLLGGGGDIGRW
jgi:hypothetical protein